MTFIPFFPIKFPTDFNYSRDILININVHTHAEGLYCCKLHFEDSLSIAHQQMH
jgi:hypothetical protein